MLHHRVLYSCQLSYFNLLFVTLRTPAVRRDECLPFCFLVVVCVCVCVTVGFTVCTSVCHFWLFLGKTDTQLYYNLLVTLLLAFDSVFSDLF